jgi:hypothetical protein
MAEVAQFLQPSKHLDNLIRLLSNVRQQCLAALEEDLPEHVRRAVEWNAACYEAEIRLLRGENVEDSR